MYHLDGELDNVLAFKALVGGDRGSCFGVRDPSRLRPPPLKLKPKEEEKTETKDTLTPEVVPKENKNKLP